MTFGRQGGARLRRLGTALGISVCCMGGALTALAQAPERAPAPMPRPAAEAPAPLVTARPAPRPSTAVAATAPAATDAPRAVAGLESGVAEAVPASGADGVPMPDALPATAAAPQADTAAGAAPLARGAGAPLAEAVTQKAEPLSGTRAALAAPARPDAARSDAPRPEAARSGPAPRPTASPTTRPAPRPAEPPQAARPLALVAAAPALPGAVPISEAAVADNDAVAAALDWPRAGPAEPAPRVQAARADTPRPEARPEPLEADISSRGSFAPLALALSPPSRPAGLAPAPTPPAPTPAAASAQPAAAAAASLAARGATAAAISSLAVAQSRLPRPRPEAERRAFVQRAAAVRVQPGPGAVTGRATGQLCGIAGIEGQPIPAVVSNVQGCGVPNAVRVKSVDGVRLSQSAIMDCETAQALHRWVRTGLKPAVGGLGGGVAELRVAAHYVCRTRNHRAGARISEHGRGRAIDISAIRLADGRVLDVLSHWRHRSYGPILRQAHAAACGPFNTTLGPGSDGMHEDHFHYDLRRGGRYCR